MKYLNRRKGWVPPLVAVNGNVTLEEEGKKAAAAVLPGSSGAVETTDGV